MSNRNFYDILNATATASLDELRRNYKQLILQCHPDKLQHDNTNTTDTTKTTTTISSITNDTTSNKTFTATVSDPNIEIPIAGTTLDELTGEFIVINEAWNTLKDPTKRRLYDAELLLTKFQAHSNIFARLTLADMKRCAATATNSGTGSDSDVDYGAGENAEGGTEGNTYWYYTYDCRCGGQYIVDESADSEILNRNRKYTAAATANSGAAKVKDDAAKQNSKQKQINKDNDKKYQAAVVGGSEAHVTPMFDGKSNNESDDSGTTNINENTQNIATTVGDVDVDDCEKQEVEEEEEEEEVLVECSECSLVIVLT